MGASMTDSESLARCGAEEFLRQEAELLQIKPGAEIGALALSGGGIRSASFALGLLQAFAKADALRAFKYLSTVSGGGYAGAALNWGRHITGLDPKDFLLDPSPQKNLPVGADSLLAHIRRRANYLAPNKRIDLLAAGYNAMRGAIASFLFYSWMMLLGFVAVAALAYVVGWGVEHFCDAIPKLAGLVGACGFEPSFVARAGLGGLAALIVVQVVATLWAFAYFLRDFVSQDDYATRLNVVVQSGWELKLYLGALVATLLPTLHGLISAAPIFGAGTDVASQSLVSAIIAAVGGIAAKISTFSQLNPKQRALALRGAAILILAALLLLVYAAGSWVVGTVLGAAGWAPVAAVEDAVDLAMQRAALGGALILLLGSFAVWWLAPGLPGPNFLSMHRFYRDRLMEIFLPEFNGIAWISRDDKHSLAGRRRGKKPLTEALNSLTKRSQQETVSREVGLNVSVWHDPDTFSLVSAKPSADAEGEPYLYPLINTNLVAVHAEQQLLCQRGGDSFLFSPLFCGSDATGWIDSESYIGGEGDRALSYITAVAISGAAANPNTGEGGALQRSPAVATLMTWLNLRLGYWMPAPSRVRKDAAGKVQRPIATLWNPGFTSLCHGGASESGGDFIEVSDGGHFDNMGLYELFRRRVRCIILSDAAADEQRQFGDLAHSLTLARSDFGVSVYFGPPEEMNAALNDRGYALGAIRYPAVDNLPVLEGLLILVKPTRLKSMPVTSWAYGEASPAFPQETTADQFFSEKQFEAYRQLGRHIGTTLMQDMDGGGGMDDRYCVLCDAQRRFHGDAVPQNAAAGKIDLGPLKRVLGPGMKVAG